MTVSMVMRCYETETRPIELNEVWRTIRTGDHDIKGKITQIRNRYEAEKDITGDPAKAKKAVADLKQELPGFLPSGSFSKREAGSLIEYSGILCADLDSLGDRLTQIRGMLKSMPFVKAIAVSPSGDGLKVFFNVVKDPARHEDSFRSIRDNLREGLEVEIDEKCKDPCRICFFTYDPELHLSDSVEILPPAEPLPPRNPGVTDVSRRQELHSSREQIAFSLLGELRPAPEKGGYFVRCPGEAFHSNKSGPKHTILYLETVPTLSCQHESCAAVVESFNQVLRSRIGKEEFRPQSDSGIPYRETRSRTLSPNGSQQIVTQPDVPHITFFSPKQVSCYIPPENVQLIGDFHLVKDTGFVTVIGGPAGVGKSLTSMALAVAGATGSGEWFGLPVHRKFKTMIIQTENGMFRLSRNFKELDCDLLEDYVRICDPPPNGLRLREEGFYLALRNEIAKFTPDVVVLDPFNSVARDQEQKTYLDTIDLIRSVLPLHTSLVIVAHTRKPKSDERSVGRSLMNIIAGSHVLVTIPRSVFVLQYASDDPEDDEVVWTCCKNNDGELGARTAWKRKTGLFLPVPNFDWATFDGADKDKRVVIQEAMILEVFESGPLHRTLARDKLMEISGASKSQVYNVLSSKGRFADHLVFKGDTIDWIK